MKNPNIKRVSNFNGIPGDQLINTSSLYRSDETIEDRKQVHKIFVDTSFCKTFGMRFIFGEDFTMYKNNTKNVIINESCSKLLGYKYPKEAVGQIVNERSRNESTYRIIGVIKDYNHRYGKYKIPPLIILNWQYCSGYIALKYEENTNLNAEIKSIQKNWTDLFPEFSFSYFYFKDYFNRQYKEDLQFFQIVKILVIIIVLLSIFGLLGLSTFYSIKRKKEVSVRRLQGASILSIIGLLCKDFTILIILGCVIGYPFSILIFNKWLETFAYRISISMQMVIGTFIFMFFISQLTVLYHNIRIAKSNPIESIREV